MCSSAIIHHMDPFTPTSLLTGAIALLVFGALATPGHFAADI